MSILDKIIDEKYIGKEHNPISVQDILSSSLNQKINTTKNEVLLIVDPQRDFIDTEKGTLAVNGAINDIKNIINFIYNNLENLSNIYITLDTHYYDSIFFECLWRDKNNNRVSPFTEVTLEKIETNEIIPIYRDLQLEYVRKLKQQNSNNLIIWPYHCLYFTDGWLIEKQLFNMILYFEFVKGIHTNKIIKGLDRFTEMYGAILPEVISSSNNNYDTNWVKEIATYDKIYICGEAKDYCLYTTIKQFCEIYNDNKEITKKVNVMMNCSSSIISEENSLKLYSELVSKYCINLINV